MRTIKESIENYKKLAQKARQITGFQEEAEEYDQLVEWLTHYDKILKNSQEDYKEGYRSGKADGMRCMCKESYDKGFADGYSEGLRQGFEAGVKNAMLSLREHSSEAVESLIQRITDDMVG